MNNFDLKKYLAENKLTKESAQTKQTAVKLYTEEQVREAIKSALDGFGIGDTQDTIDLIVSKYNPIELPSDEEIENEVNYNVHIHNDEDFINGAKWFKEQLKK